jgi:hypothetical protein
VPFLFPGLCEFLGKIPYRGENFPISQKTDGDNNKPKSVPNGTLSVGKKFPSGGG